MAYQRYTSALIRTDKVERAYDLIGGWMKSATSGQRDVELTAVDRARLDASINILFGYGHGVPRKQVEERFHKPLANLVRKYALSRTNRQYVTRIMNDYRYRYS